MFCGPEVQARLTGQAERACSAVADEEEAVTGPVPSKATEIIVKLRLRRLGFDLHPGRLSDCRLSEDQVHVRLVLAQDTAALPTAPRKNQIDQGLKISPIELPNHAQADFAHQPDAPPPTEAQVLASKTAMRPHFLLRPPTGPVPWYGKANGKLGVAYANLANLPTSRDGRD